MKTIIITGANGNLGTATVKKFLDEGIYRVIAVDHSGTHLGFADAHHDFELHSIELTDEAATNDFVTEAISLYGQIDGALLLAGGYGAGNIEATTDADVSDDAPEEEVHISVRNNRRLGELPVHSRHPWSLPPARIPFPLA